MSAELQDVYKTGAAIAAVAAQLDIPLGEAAPAELTSRGWTIESSSDAGLYASRLDDAVQSHVHYASREFAAPASRLVCLVREFDVGKLAGQLTDFHVHSSSPSLTRVEYVSALPWPFEPRWILADMQFGVDRTTGHYLILGRSVPGAQVPAGKPHTSLGTVHYSMYIIEPKGEDRCVMRRAINVDMHIKLPSFVIRKSLVAHYISDMAVVEKELGRKWPGSELERRFGERECYRLLERASAEARGSC